MSASRPPQLRAADVVSALREHRSAPELVKVRARLAADEPALGMRMRDVFDVAKSFADLSLAEVDNLLDENEYESRLAAFCILDFQARRRLTDEERRDRCELYVRRHDRITTWDMVDRAAPRVVGQSLAGGPLTLLHELAGADDTLRRRSAITAPLFFARYGGDDELAESLDIAAQLASDADPVVHNAVGIFLKHAGGRDASALLQFLDEHAADMPRPAVRLAVEKLAPDDRRRFLR